MDDATIGDLANLATLTSAYIGLVAQLEDRSSELKAIRELLKKERTWRRYSTPSLDHYLWSHGYKVSKSHISQSCDYPNDGHKREATKNNNMGGSQANKE
jgi:hypothetical protein